MNDQEWQELIESIIDRETIDQELFENDPIPDNYGPDGLSMFLIPQG
jgi:hypothetical protein